MAQASFTEFHANLARFFDEAESNRAPLLVTRTGRANMVLLSEAEFEGWRETVHLLGNPRNAARLLRGVRALDAGLGEEHELIQPKTSEDASG